MRFIIDCSVVMAWCFEDEADDETNTVLDALMGAEAWVPGLWVLEVANVLWVAERKERLSEADSMHFLDLLGDLPIKVDENASLQRTTHILNLARAQNLSAYDSAYLDLAMRSGLPLATRDQALRQAAQRTGVTLFQGSE